MSSLAAPMLLQLLQIFQNFVENQLINKLLSKSGYNLGRRKVGQIPMSTVTKEHRRVLKLLSHQPLSSLH
jgi:hypothetical protein